MPWGRPSCMSRSLTNYTLYYLKKFHNIDDIFIDYFSHISMHVFANCFPDLWLLICPCWCVLVKNFKCRIPLLVFVCGRFLRWWRRSCTGGRLYWLYKGKLRVQRQEGRPCLVLIHWWASASSQFLLLHFAGFLDGSAGIQKYCERTIHLFYLVLPREGCKIDSILYS